MREVVLTVLIVVVLVGLGLATLLPWETLFDAGAWLIFVGMLVGVPTGVVYHVLLYRSLEPRGELPSGWYWSAIKFNKLLLETERDTVMPWVYVSGLFFFVVVLGLLAIGAAMLAAYAQITGV